MSRCWQAWVIGFVFFLWPRQITQADLIHNRAENFTHNFSYHTKNLGKLYITRLESCIRLYRIGSSVDTITPFKMIRGAGQHELITQIPKSRILLSMSSRKSNHDILSISYKQHLRLKNLMILHSPVSSYITVAYPQHNAHSQNGSVLITDTE